jgi:RNA methyltransferase, TrmH family
MPSSLLHNGLRVDIKKNRKMVKIESSKMLELQKITSRDNQRLIGARRIRDGQGAGKMFIEGKRLAAEALRSDLAISECFVSERFVASSENATLLDSVADRARFTFELPDRLFYTISATENTQGIALIADRPDRSAKSIEARLNAGTCLPLVLLLFEINNPSNLGAILRTAEGANVAGVIVSKHSADAHSPKALRASMGAAFRLPVWIDVDFQLAMTWARDQGLVATAATVHEATPFTDLNWTTRRILILGSEAHGLGTDELERAADHAYIPMENDVESLNLAVAAGIFLYETKRQNS